MSSSALNHSASTPGAGRDLQADCGSGDEEAAAGKLPREQGEEGRSGSGELLRSTRLFSRCSGGRSRLCDGRCELGLAGGKGAGRWGRGRRRQGQGCQRQGCQRQVHGTLAVLAAGLAAGLAARLAAGLAAGPGLPVRPAGRRSARLVSGHSSCGDQERIARLPAQQWIGGQVGRQAGVQVSRSVARSVSQSGSRAVGQQISR